MKLKSYIALGVASAAVLGGANAAEAAALQGRVGINPPSPAEGEESGVIFIGTGITVDNDEGQTVPLTNFDFVPPVEGGVGTVVELNANPLPTGEDDFAPFVGQTGEILDLDAAALTPGDFPIEDFINIPGAFSASLTSVDFPVYSEDDGGTTVAIGVGAQFINLSDGSGDVSTGVGTFSVDFAGLSIAETQALFDEDGEIPEQFSPGTWSSNFVVTAEEDVTPPGPTPVPEASNLLGLLVIGFGGASMLIRKK